MTRLTPIVDAEAVAIAVDRMLSRHPGGGPRSHVLRLSRDVLLPLSSALANPQITFADAFTKLANDLGERCPGRSALYRYAECFIPVYAEVKSERDGSHICPELAALPLHEVGRRLCLKPEQVQALIDEGKLRGLHLAGEVRVPIASLQAMLGGAQ